MEAREEPGQRIFESSLDGRPEPIFRDLVAAALQDLGVAHHVRDQPIEVRARRLKARLHGQARLDPFRRGWDRARVKGFLGRVVSAQLQKSQGRIGRLASKPRQSGERCRMGI